jgi:hypothetical protein
MTQLRAEELPYWQTSTTDPDTWIEKTIRILSTLGGQMKMEAFGKDGAGRGAFILTFTIKGENYRAVWPVMPTQSGKTRAAKIQAATSLYHYVKAISLAAAVIGEKAALFTFLELPDGSTVAENVDTSLLQASKMFQLPSGDNEIYQGEVKEIP